MMLTDEASLFLVPPISSLFLSKVLSIVSGVHVSDRLRILHQHSLEDDMSRAVGR
ncbi:unnamed protein product [Ectocarpus sp. CCAP 1310/34]|nr:unnamed protein product [Ectocarpus sp. CCAP 1310/34]